MYSYFLNLYNKNKTTQNVKKKRQETGSVTGIELSDD